MSGALQATDVGGARNFHETFNLGQYVWSGDGCPSNMIESMLAGMDASVMDVPVTVMFFFFLASMEGL